MTPDGSKSYSLRPPLATIAVSLNTVLIPLTAILISRFGVIGALSAIALLSTA